MTIKAITVLPSFRWWLPPPVECESPPVVAAVVGTLDVPVGPVAARVLALSAVESVVDSAETVASVTGPVVPVAAAVVVVATVVESARVVATVEAARELATAVVDVVRWLPVAALAVAATVVVSALAVDATLVLKDTVAAVEAAGGAA